LLQATVLWFFCEYDVYAIACVHPSLSPPGIPSVRNEGMNRLIGALTLHVLSFSSTREIKEKSLEGGRRYTRSWRIDSQVVESYTNLYLQQVFLIIDFHRLPRISSIKA
jgi:hypothetical protein